MSTIKLTPTQGTVSMRPVMGREGPRGMPGVNAVENDTAVAAYVGDNLADTYAAVNTRIATKVAADADDAGSTIGAALSATFGWLTPTGVAAADTTTLQAALDAAETAAGGVVRLAADTTWNIDTTLTLGDHVHLTGQGPSTLLKAVTDLNAPVITNTDTATGNTDIKVSDLAVDGNLANQSGDNISPLDFWRVTDSQFLNLDVQGGKRNTTFVGGTGTNGEGIVLRYSDRNLISGGHYHHNEYDGIKLRASNYNRVADVVCSENGRAGIQIAFQDTDNTAPYNDGEGVFEAGSNYNTFSNVVVTHSTGLPGPGSPSTSGFYIHTGAFNTVTNLVVEGVANGIGLYANASNNTFSGGLLRCRLEANLGAIDINSNSISNLRNTFVGITHSAITGDTTMQHVRLVAGNFNEFIGCQFLKGDAAGTLFITIASGREDTLIYGCMSDGVLSDSGTRTLFQSPSWGGTSFRGNYMFGLSNLPINGGVGVVGIKNAATVPTANASGGGTLYVEAGALKYRGSSGTVTTLGIA